MAERDATGWSSSEYSQTASFVYSQEFTSPVLDLLAAKPGEKIIDFGCGNGELTLAVGNTLGPEGLIVGVDASESMITQAKFNGLEHSYIADLQDLIEPSSTLLAIQAHAPTQYDAILSNATLHWCKKSPLNVLIGAHKLLKKGGRFAGELGGFGNLTGLRSTLHYVLASRGYDPVEWDPWFFPSVEDYSRLLVAARFEIKSIALVPRITPVPKGLLAWLDLFVRPRFPAAKFTQEEITDIFKEVEKICTIDGQDTQGNWSVMYVRLRFLAIAV